MSEDQDPKIETPPSPSVAAHKANPQQARDLERLALRVGAPLETDADYDALHDAFVKSKTSAMNAQGWLERHYNVKRTAAMQAAAPEPAMKAPATKKQVALEERDPYSWTPEEVDHLSRTKGSNWVGAAVRKAANGRSVRVDHVVKHTPEHFIPTAPDLVSMSEADRSALIRDKGLNWYRTELMNQMRGKSIKVDR